MLQFQVFCFIGSNFKLDDPLSEFVLDSDLCLAADHFGEFLILRLHCQEEFVSIKVMINLKVVNIILLKMHLTQIQIKHHYPLIILDIIVDKQIRILNLPKEVHPVLLIVKLQGYIALEVLFKPLSYLL